MSSGCCLNKEILAPVTVQPIDGNFIESGTVVQPYDSNYDY